MAHYSYLCPGCGASAALNRPISEGPPVEVFCEQHTNPVSMKRDYRSDVPVFGNRVEMAREREAGGASAMRDLFLPTNDDYKGPADPDGNKGMKQWREEHSPRESNKRPNWPGSVSKEFF